jgi:hypothetical protein
MPRLLSLTTTIPAFLCFPIQLFLPLVPHPCYILFYFIRYAVPALDPSHNPYRDLRWRWPVAGGPG